MTSTLFFTVACIKASTYRLEMARAAHDLLI